MDTQGIITSVAGDGVWGPSGDGGLATNAAVAAPLGATADAFGNLFIVGAGENRIRKVTNTQGPALALNNVSSHDAGNYQVVVTGSGGSVTSRVAKLTVATSPLIYSALPNSGGSATLCFVSRPGSTNVVLCATNLSPPVSWQPLSTNLAGADGDWQYTDTNFANRQSRFYRSATQ